MKNKKMNERDETIARTSGDESAKKCIGAKSNKMVLVWSKLPKFLGRALLTLCIFLFGISINGDWISLYVHIGKQFGYLPRVTNVSAFSFDDVTLESLRLKNFGSFWFFALIISYSLYIGIGGFIQWYFYILQHDKSEEWKCQPNKWLSPDVERHEILVGSFTLFLNSTLTSLVACYIANGGYSKVYYEIGEYGLPWYLIQIVVLFVFEDYLIYWLHRIYHIPFLYRNFHKLHHKYKHPTAFSVTAIHPVESMNIQIFTIAPLFLVPLHWSAFYLVALYVYYHGIINHSGVDFKAYWWQPWQPDTIFHDNHHQYFHVNFAFNIGLWDKIHGTYRRKDRIYREDIFYGKGKSLKEIDQNELEQEVEERANENPKAHRGSRADYEIPSDTIIKNK